MGKLFPKVIGKESGITLTEILVVLVLFSAIYLVLSRNMGYGNDKAKVTDVQQAFKRYHESFESAMSELGGLPSDNEINTDYSRLNRYIGVNFKINNPSSVSDNHVHPIANPIQESTLKDPWGTPYYIQAKYLSPDEALLLVRSKGKDKKNNATTDLFYDTSATTDEDDFMMVTHFKNETVRSCTKGFVKNVGQLEYSSQNANFDVTLYNRRATLENYRYEYAVEIEYNEMVYRTYVYSRTPLNMVVKQNGKFKELKDDNGNSMNGYDWWELVQYWDGSYGENFYPAPMPFTIERAGFATLKGFYLNVNEVDGEDMAHYISGCKGV